MNPVSIGRHSLRMGDCVELMRALPPDSFDSCVTDPPYGLGFMGKAWDCDVPGADFAAELFRVLKPGAHACLFGGTRTFHRLTVALEDAGFEVRDVLCWLYGTGFPKSLDVSKAIDDKLGAEREVIGVNSNHRVTSGKAYARVYSGGNTSAEHITAPATAEAAAWEGWGTALKPAVEYAVVVQKPFDDQRERHETLGSLKVLEARLCLLLSVTRAELDSTSSPVVSSEALGSARWSAAELRSTWGDLSALTDTWPFALAVSTCLSTVTSWRSTLEGASTPESTSITGTATSLTIDWKTLSFCASKLTPQSITQAAIQVPGSWWSAVPAALALHAAAASIESTRTRSALESATSAARARRLDGIDPAVDWEPVVLVRKPLIGTVAENVLAHGTGGLNIDATRIEGAPNVPGSAGYKGGESAIFGAGWNATAALRAQAYRDNPPSGRWPANVVLDEEAAAVLDAQAGESKSSGAPRRNGDFKSNSKGRERAHTTYGHDDFGGASRFFYVAKPSRAERDRGCDALRVRSGGEATDREDGAAGTQSPRAGAGRTGGARNIHPTVKPVELMRWLVRLVTPPGGSVLDPFMGSGTTGIAAHEERAVFIGIERDPEYFEIARLRIEDACRQGQLF